MAKSGKWFGKDDDRAKDADQTPSNTTSGGEQPTPTDDVAKIDGAEGTAVYPPSPPDQAGEKTDNVAPTKRLPPDVPPEEGGGVDEVTRLTAERDALARVVRNLGGNPDEVAKAATAGMAEKATAAKKGPTKKAFVTPAGGTEVEVEYPADAENPEAAAVESYKAQAGIWSMPSQPAVRLDEGKPARGKKKAADEGE